MTRSERLFDKLKNIALGLEVCDLEMWDMFSKVTCRVLYNVKEETFIVGFEPNDSTVFTYGDHRDNSIKIIRKKDFKTEEEWIVAVVLAWEMHEDIGLRSLKKMAVPRNLYKRTEEIIRKDLKVTIDSFKVNRGTDNETTYTLENRGGLLVLTSRIKGQPVEINKEVTFTSNKFKLAPVSRMLRRWEELKIITTTVRRYK